ncbi:hypothetical protein FOA43_003252 [Brettanomyces nanus]|uniref:A to I editase domain-containing protein n=1 Tax=Eeniella nana TaxID=13502 RepID=A0A875S3F6_EENNA|nr:uncharacterized protein FOA43_003252 [Brettanomyces nanus]QPG75866.1 hypothetical protein FOA43_003252 [Brettanomyces nanus]
MATGVKAISSRKIEQTSHGRIVHDMHAEVLSLRIFNFFLLKDVEEMTRMNERQGRLLEMTDNDRYKLKDKTMELAMYVTDIPCGDASIDNVREEMDDDKKENWKESSSEIEDNLRGRAFFGAVGKVRTKPGRIDSPISYSKSCSDKLCMKQFTGILNSTTYDLIEEGEARRQMYLKYLVLPEKRIRVKGIERCFYNRFQRKLGEFQEIRDCLQPLKVITTNLSSQKFHLCLDKEKKSCDQSILYCPPLKYVQVLNKGIRNGCSAKKKPIDKQSRTDVSREALMDRLKSTKEVNSSTYLQFKMNIRNLRAIRIKVKQLLGNWTKSSTDNFPI